MESEAVDEIEFESVQVPVYQGIDIQIHQMFPDLRETRIKHAAAADPVIVEVLSLKFLVGVAMPSDVWDTVPDKIFHSEIMNCRNVGSHIRKFLGSRSPVSAKSITSVSVSRLPTVIKNYGFHSEIRRNTALLFNRFGIYVLVELVPA